MLTPISIVISIMIKQAEPLLKQFKVHLLTDTSLMHQKDMPISKTSVPISRKSRGERSKFILGTLTIILLKP